MLAHLQGGSDQVGERLPGGFRAHRPEDDAHRLGRARAAREQLFLRKEEPRGPVMQEADFPKCYLAAQAYCNHPLE